MPCAISLTHGCAADASYAGRLHTYTREGGFSMKVQQTTGAGLRRRDVLTGLMASCPVRRTLLPSSRALGSQRRAAQARRTLRVRGRDPPHFDPHLTLNFKTNTTLSPQ